MGNRLVQAALERPMTCFVKWAKHPTRLNCEATKARVPQVDCGAFLEGQPFHFFDDLQDPSTSISEQLARLVAELDDVGEVCGGLLALARRRCQRSGGLV
jgi:hypothetical protein